MDSLQKLIDLGAGTIDHIDGALVDHLERTRSILLEWGASKTLQDAGLYHAIYSTSGFEREILSVDDRKKVALIIGDDAEEIVYQYCACDRELFFPLIGVESRPLFTNRFTGESYYLSNNMFHDFCELTAANEIEISTQNPKFLFENGKALRKIFTRMSPFLSEKATAACLETFET